MSDGDEADKKSCCASCGIAEVDNVKLVPCDDCDLVQYCSDECQQDHRPEHEARCKERAAELREEILFRQPESSHLGDCPICFLPLPIDPRKTSMNACCCKIICKGCSIANESRQMKEIIQQTCLFCRHPLPKTVEEADKMIMKRVEANDTVAQCHYALDLIEEGDYATAFRYYTKAAELGDADAHYRLAHMYLNGEGVEKDEKKEIYHLEEASIRGHPNARHSLGVYEKNNGEIDRAVKHFIIAANLGLDDSIQVLTEYYKDDSVSKEDFAAALRAHHAAVDAMKSPQREVTAGCASCGIAEVDGVKLVQCDGCDLVKYCSDQCQKDHRPKHKKECQKRAAELHHDEILFKQPESTNLGDCPICCLPLPQTNGLAKPTFMKCCSKYMCIGCDFAQFKLGLEGKLQLKCPFCREAFPLTKEEINGQLMRRVEANDPVAMCQMGWERDREGDYKAAFEYWTRAAALGDVKAHFHLSIMYSLGKGVEKDKKRELHHAEQAAIGGNPTARHNLALLEVKDGRVDRAAKHWIIAAKLGHDESLKGIKSLYKAGYVRKEDFASALRGHQAATDALRSPQREETAKFLAENSWIVRGR